MARHLSSSHLNPFAEFMDGKLGHWDGAIVSTCSLAPILAWIWIRIQTEMRRCSAGGPATPSRLSSLWCSAQCGVCAMSALSLDVHVKPMIASPLQQMLPQQQQQQKWQWQLLGAAFLRLENRHTKIINSDFHLPRRLS